MKVRMKVGISGHYVDADGTHDWPAIGETVELPEILATDMCASQLAVPVVDDEVETATAPEPEVRSDEPFDPSEHSVADVLAYLAGVETSDEAVRVLDAEAAGKNRAGVVGKWEDVLARFESGQGS